MLNSGKDDELAPVGPLLERLGDWRVFLGQRLVARLEKLLGRVFQRQKPGPKGPRKEQK